MHPKDKTNGLTAERLRQVLLYEPETGLFRRRIPWAGRPIGSIAGMKRPDGYLWASVDNHRVLLHRLAWLYMTGEWPDQQIDHIDLDKGNNRWANLREATNQQNQFNRIDWPSKTGFRGVHRRKDRFYAVYRHNYRLIHLGHFDTPEEASAAYQAAIAYRGEYRPSP